METPLEIRFHKLERSAMIEQAVRERAVKLERFADKIISCRVTVGSPRRKAAISIFIATASSMRISSSSRSEHGSGSPKRRAT